MGDLQLDLSLYKPVNNLWNEFSKTFGVDKAAKAISQSIDIQHMKGSEETLPVLFMETCGIGLLNIEAVKSQTGLSLHGTNQIIIISIKKGLFQLLQKVK